MAKKTVKDKVNPLLRKQKIIKPSSPALPEESHFTQSSNTFPVVGIGASAGGLDAFKKLLKAIPENCGMAFVLVQHLHPKYESMLPELLQKVTSIPVLEISDEIKVQPNHIYIIPSNKMMIANDGVLLLSPRTPGRKGTDGTNKNEGNLPIDLFFTSLSEVHQSHSIGVVLSGTGSDGTRGLKAIKDHGGITIAQNQESAQYDGMPQNAIQAGVVDFILIPEEIPQKLLEITKIINGTAAEEDIIQLQEELFKQVLALLRIRKGTDFTYYKQTTIRRRILRRMVMNKNEEPATYLNYLKENKPEQDVLYQDLLIPVTSFFRDPKSFDNLCKTVFPSIVKNKATVDPIRVWVAGCSTGQEVYSIAICLKEFLASSPSFRGGRGGALQLFATDISEAAIGKARTGIYTKTEIESLSPQRLQEFFTKINGSYQVNKSIRDICVFAVHNFLKDPPFGKLDLISCRNVLIYMEPYLQKKALTTFHYALNNNGFLLLGKSETISTVPELFGIAQKGDKIFNRKDVPGKYMLTATQPSEQGMADVNVNAKRNPDLSGHPDFQKTADDIMLSKYTPTGVVVNEAMDIVHFRGKTSHYLEQLPGKPSHNLLKMAKEGLAFELRNILHKAKKEKAPVTKENIPVQINGNLRNITIEAMPLPDTIEPHYMVLFHETTAANSRFPIPNFKPLAKTKKSSAHSPLLAAQNRIAQLEKELAQLREDMRSITEDQEAANEELQTANEELLSGSEELQSLNEELETGKEELQSTNEELTVVNQEMIGLNEQLTESKNYAETIIDTLREPLLVLDKHMRIISGNKSFFSAFQVNEKETQGKLIYELGNKQWNIPALRTLLENVLPQNQSFADFEVSFNFPHIGQRTMLLNASEIINEKRTDKLILISFGDITERRIVEKKILTNEQRFRDLLLQSPFAIALCKGEDMEINLANDAMKDVWGKGKEVEGKSIFELLDEVSIAGFKKLLLNVYKTGKAYFGIEEMAVMRRNGILTETFYNFVYQPYYEADGSISGIVCIAYEVTEQVLAKRKVDENAKQLQNIFRHAPAAIALLQIPEQKFNMANEVYQKIFSRTEEQLIGKTIKEVFPELDGQGIFEILENVGNSGQPYIAHEFPARFNDSGIIKSAYYDFVAQPFKNSEGIMTNIMIHAFEVTEQVAARKIIEDSENLFRLALAGSAQIVFSQDTELRHTWIYNSLPDFKAEEIIGKTDNDLHTPKTAQLLTGIKQAIIDTGNPYDGEVEIEVGGQRVFYDMHIEAIKDDREHISGIIGSVTDITETKKTNEKIKESEERYHNLIYSSPSAIGILHGESLVITIANDAIIEIWGKGKELIGRPYFEALPELAEQGYKEIFHQVYTTGKPFNSVETPVNILQNGKMELKYYNFLLHAQRNAKDVIDGIGIIATEVTSQAIFNKKIKESEEQFSTLAENMENLAWLADADGSIYWYNKRWYDYTGTTLEEMEGWGWQKVHHPDHVDSIINFVKDAWHKNEAFELTFPLLGKDGEYRWFLTRAYPIADEQGKVIRWIGTNTNIDNQKKAEVEIKYRKALLEAHNESSVDGILLTNDKGKIISFNKRYIEIWSMPKPVSEPMEDEAIIEHTLAQLQNKEELIEKNKYIYEHPLEAGSILLSFKDGKIVERHNYPVMGEDGSFYGVSLTHRDITEQKSAQTLLEYRKALLEAHNESSVDGILLVDAKGKIISYNHRFIEIWNMPQHIVDAKEDEAALSHAMTQLVHPAQFMEKVKWLYEHPTETSKDILEYKDGKIVERHGYPVVAEDGSYYAWSWTFRDITEIRKAEFVLRQSEENFRQLAELMPDKISTADPSGVITYYSKNWEEYTGMLREQLYTEGYSMLMHPDEAEALVKRWQHCVETGEDFESELRVRNQAGNYRWHLSRASAVKDEKGKVVKWIGSMTEIQQQKIQRIELEKAVLERTQELQKANEALGDKNEELVSLNKELESFAYVSSHDLQEPLRKIQTFGSYIADREKQNLSSNGQVYFNKMQEAATRMRNLIDDLLAYSRTNSRDRKFETVNLNNVVDEVKNDLKETIEEKKATIEVGEMCAASIIPFQFQQLFNNLITNSLKFSIPGKPSHITIKSEKGSGAELNSINPDLVANRLLLQKQYCHICIADNGIGFDPDYKDRIFNLFQRLHGKNEYPGTGIGLAIVKKIVDNHHGIITASGAINKGAKFDIYIPSEHSDSEG